MSAPTIILPPRLDARWSTYWLVRDDERRALRARLRRAVEELEACRRKAVEIGDVEAAERIRGGIEAWGEAVVGVERDCR